MKINLKFGQKQKPVQTGLQVHTHMLAGFLNCKDFCLVMYPPIQGLEYLFDNCVKSCTV